MKKFKLYLFTQDNYRGGSYGIGTYLNQLIKSLYGCEKVDLALIHLFSQEKRWKIEEKENYREIFIPSVKSPLSVTGRVFENRYFRNAVYLLKDILPDDPNTIFHFNFTSQRTLITWVKKILPGKIILTLHYTDWSFNLLGNKKRLKKILSKSFVQQKDTLGKLVLGGIEQDKKVIQLCDKVICIAQHSYDSIIEIAQEYKHKFVLIPHGIEDGYHSLSSIRKKELRKKYGIDDSLKIILFAGRLDEIKGLTDLITSFKKLILDYPSAHLIIAGEGNFNQWFSMMKECRTKITFTGKLDKKQLYDWYKISDIGVTCPLYEEFGLVAIEMMMHKLPLVVTDTGGLSEIVDDGVTGLKVSVKKRKNRSIVDVNQLVQQLKFLLSNPELASQLGKNARKKFLEKYELTDFKNNMLNFYNNIKNENT